MTITRPRFSASLPQSLAPIGVGKTLGDFAMREKILMGAMLAGMAFVNTSVGAVPTP